ncbi:MAG TPA: polyprenyl synthetase family protein [Gemmatimonadaceae bacterium]|nr:polyprenyl synthetase family protein [Gemmatimonadaceae bacterium]
MTATARPRSPLTPPLARIQMPVRAGLDQVSEEMVRIVVTDTPLIGEVSRHLLGMKGKMFRPTLVLLASQVDESPTSRAATLGAVVELIHLATLVHDDSVDHSVLRRGMPTVNALFSHQISVIMGDFLYSRALLELVRLRDLESLGVLAKASNEMTLGEMRQLALNDPLAFSEEDYNLLIRAKTASLMSAACEVGALCGASGHRAALARFGEAMGMAFQIADDLLDYTAEKETTGKPTGLDLREHKVTLPLIAALRTMGAPARAEVDSFFAASEPEDAAVARIVEIVSEEGGLEYARARGDEYVAEAEEALDRLPASEATSALRSAIAYVMERHS